MVEQMMQGAAGKMVGHMAIPAGYKQTEAGVIPNDWICSRMGDISAVIRGASPRPKGDKRFYGGSVPRLMVEDVSRDGKFVTPIVDSLTEAGAKLSRPCTAGTLTLVCSGVVGVPSILAVDACIHDGFLGITKLNRNVIVDYLYHFFATQQEKLNSSATHGGVFTNLTTEAVKGFHVAIPENRQEQTVIAQALSDADALIAGLEQLIAKKQAIKTATMQQLLTGRTRLPQFALCPDGTQKGYKSSELGQIPKDWNVVGFGELFENNVQRQSLRKDELVSFVGMQDVSENANLIAQDKRPFSEIKTGFTYFEKGDVLVAKITPCFENGKGCHTESLMTEIGFGSTEFHVLRAKKTSNSNFIYYWTTKTSLRIALEAEMVGSAGHRRVPFSALQSYLIPCSTDKNEQTAIATILTDMDKELAALEQKLAKARALKQGMMQQLLTGRIRLPLPKEV